MIYNFPISALFAWIGAKEARKEKDRYTQRDVYRLLKLHSNFQRVNITSWVEVNLTPYGGVTLFGVITFAKNSYL